MNWENHKTITKFNHDANNCYCCQLPAIHRVKSKQWRKLQYLYNVTTIQPPNPLPFYRTEALESIAEEGVEETLNTNKLQFLQSAS